MGYIGLYCVELGGFRWFLLILFRLCCAESKSIYNKVSRTVTVGLARGGVSACHKTNFKG